LKKGRSNHQSRRIGVRDKGKGARVDVRRERANWQKKKEGPLRTERAIIKGKKSSGFALGKKKERIRQSKGKRKKWS